MGRPRDLDGYAIALAGDCGAVPERPVVTPPRARRSRRVTILLLLAWLAWEIGGAIRAITFGVPVLKAIWGLHL